MLRQLTVLCAARQRLALAIGLADEGHPLLGALPLELVFCMCEVAQAASALLGRSELRMRVMAAALPELEPEPEPAPAAKQAVEYDNAATRPAACCRSPSPYH